MEKMNNYRVDIIFREHHYSALFPEYWLAKVYADAIAKDDEVSDVYILERLMLHSNNAKTTGSYIGLTKQKVDKYYEDFGSFLKEYIVEGKEYDGEFDITRKIK